MNLFKTRLCTLTLLSAFLLPAAASAAASTDSTTSTTTTTTSTSTVAAPQAASPIVQTDVNGVLVPGLYLINSDSRVAFIPGGVGLVVVNKGTALPLGAYYVNK
ncbi:hypothetical protein [Paenibacillus rigui]|uniref:Uncharacterized protein n=1 Tax=Paenibacillus rigui TaxID=554312 RepID=A0A229UM94_9BACL|nr:hypothetical protein [Paenibacillus rigui]OXM84492.1 hypothetical protein CF651_20270 [Paenibacillus rigui]